MPAIQVKHVPEELHEELRARAEAEGKTLSAYLLELIRRDLRKPRFKAWVEELQKLPDLDRPIETTTAELMAEMRAERERDEDELLEQLLARRRSGSESGSGRR